MTSAPALLDLSSAAALVVEPHRAAPCAVVAAAVRRDGTWVRGIGAGGRLWFSEDAPPASPTTLFDLASVTKSVTALTAARLSRVGKLSWSEALADVLPSLAETRSARVPLSLFAAHRAGLEAHRSFFGPLLRGLPVDRAAALRLAADSRREGLGSADDEGFPPVYSDLGYLLLGEAIAARGGADLDRLQAREVLDPLGLDIGSARALRARAVGFDTRVAPTELAPWRDGVVRGVTHDENAWALAGDGAAGHAGLFGDARSVAELGVAVLDALAGRRSDFLDARDLEPLLRARPGGSLLAGFDSRSGDAPSSGALFGPRTFGHLGFTGTSLWIDPEAQLVGVLLTNRVHPTRTNDAIRRARPAVYDALASTMLGCRRVERQP